jgi:ribosomal protein S18 acetylase RimI-like enzyme
MNREAPHIRAGQQSDIRKIVKIFRGEYKKYPYNEKWSEKTALDKIKDYSKSSKIFVVELEDRVVGFIILHTHLWDDGEVGFIDEIIVTEKFQGKGLGKLLMNKAEEYFRKNKIKRYELMSSTKSKAFKFYQKIGFKRIKDFAYMCKTIR